MRQDQQTWQREERALAYRLLGEYRRVNVTLSSLTSEDRVNIGGLIKDPKYLSLLELHKLLKAKMLKQVVYQQLDSNQENLNKAAVMILTTIESAVKDYYRSSEEGRAEKEMKDKLLHNYGW